MSATRLPIIGTDCCEVKTVPNVKQGTYLKTKPNAKKVYKRGAYLGNGTYELIDTDDISRTITMKRTSFVYLGFTY